MIRGELGAQTARRAPASLHQESLWLVNELAPASASYNNIVGLRLQGDLDVGTLRRAIHEVVRRHETLRTTFEMAGGSLAQLIAPELEIEVPVVDVAAGGCAASDPEVLRRAEEEARRPLDLRRGPLIRATLLRAAADDHLLVVTLHHIIADGWSVGIFLRDLTAVYAAFAAGRPSPLPEPALQYADYAAGQRERLGGPRLERELAHWRRALQDAPRFLTLPTDRPRPRAQSDAGATHRFTLPASLVRRLRDRCRSEGVTLFMALLAAYEVLLHRYSGQDDVLVGTPVTNRFRSELEGVLGYFLNMLVVRADLSGDPGFGELLRRVKRATLAAYGHAELPFDRLLEDLRPPRDPGRSPLFQVAFAVQGGPGQDLHAAGLSIPGLLLEPMEIAPGASKYDLTLCMIDEPDRLTGHLEYRADLFDERTVARMAVHLQAILDGALRDPDLPVSRLPLLDAGERARLLYEWNDAGAAPAAERCIHRLFEEQADRTPDAIAIVAGSERWTYADLDRRANQLAHRLRRHGIGPERMVGLLLQRSAHLPVALLGVLKAGGAYVALDPDHPPERLSFLLRDAQVALVLTEDRLADRLPAGTPPALRLDGEAADLAGECVERPHDLSHPRNLAYAVYTSGSTGRPKAVATEHRNAVSLIDWARRAYSRDALAGVLAGSSACFDCTPFEVFAPLASGGTAVVCGTSLDLPTLPAAGDVRLVSTVPSVVVELVRSGGLPDSVRVLNIGGEALAPSLVRQVYETTGVERLYNLYGPSEATTYATRTLLPRASGAALQEGGSVPIGRPISNTRAYVLDRNLELVPAGVVGQLCLSGGGLARGYLNRPALTAARFVPHPFSEEPGARLYLTGDLARHLPNGDLDFVGRIDDQVKIRGIRVEPGEVQAILNAHPDVRESLVVPEAGPQGVRLVAYLLPRDGVELTAAALRRHLGDRVPAHMIPGAFVTVDRFQLAGNGKIDRRALPAADLVEHQAYAPPRTPEEEILAGIWEDVLEVDRVGAHDNFFELGGHSLLGLQVVARIGQRLGAEVPLTALFETATLGELAERLRGARAAEPEEPILAASGDGPRPLSYAQQRVWFLEQFTRGSVAYNVPVALRLHGPLDAPALEAALREIVRRHHALRAQVRTDAGRPAQFVRPEAGLSLPVTDVAGEAAALEAARAEVARPFDLEHDLLVRARLLRLAEDDHVLVLVLHHIATDGWSMGIVREELAALYRAFREGQPSPLAPPPVQYPDFAVWQRHWLESPRVQRQLDYWKARLAGLPEALDLPADRPRPAVRGSAGATALFKVPPRVTDRLRKLARDEGATLYMVLLAVFQVLLRRYSGQTDIRVGTPVAGRARAELERTVGFFLNTLVLRGDLAGNPGFRRLLEHVRRDTLDAFANQDLPFERLVEELNLPRDLSRTPLFQAMFTLQNARPGEFRMEGLQVAPLALENPSAKFDLDLTMLESEAYLYGGLNYSTDLFEPATARRMVRHFQHLLEAVADDPDRAIDELVMLGPAERRRLVAARPGAAEAPPAPVPELVAAQARRRPEAVAVTGDRGSLTYGELERRANQLARRLRACGVRPDERVGVCVDRSPALIVALLGILRAGAAYVPFDPSYPPARLAAMRDDAGARVLVTETRLESALAWEAGPVVRLDAEAAALDRLPTEPLEPPVPEQLAYVLFTSGSTGRPKGVSVPHRALANVLASFAREPGLGPDDVLLAVTSVSFDIAGLELFLPLACGARVVIAGADEAADGDRLAALIERHGVTALQATPVTWRLLLDSGWKAPRGLLGLCGGEAMPLDLPGRLADLGVRLWNVYGPTETTIWSTLAPVERDRPITIGRPVGSTGLYVLDAALEPVPVGVPGELYIGGAGLARGYLDRPGQTAERFLPNPFGAPGERMYRTGDAVRLLASGELEHRGRLDGQVKLRGHRIELGEIEAALLEHPAVVRAAAAIRDGRLLAYTVAADGAAVTGAELRAHLRWLLPDFMQPAAFVALERLPLTPAGKLDRRALPAEAGESPGRPTFAAPRTADERALAAIWADVLEYDPVSVHDDFFDLGGESLRAARVASRLRDELGVDLPLRFLFAFPTVAELAPLLDVARANGGEWPEDLDPAACVSEAS